jgi:pimeloyl-ACP methyl ester carboxylesterase
MPANNREMRPGFSGRVKKAWPAQTAFMVIDPLEIITKSVKSTVSGGDANHLSYQCQSKCGLRRRAYDRFNARVNVAYVGGHMTDRRQFLKRDASIASEETLLLLIHGLAGSNKGTWGELPTILRKAEDLGQEVTIDFFSYPSMLFRRPFLKRGPKIQELARGLRTQIENRFGSFKRIILICHSLGGLVARQYLLDESRANHRTRIVGLVLFAVPNNGDDLAKLVALFPFGNHQIRQLRPDSDFIENLNEDWAARRLQESVHVIYVIGAQDKVVKKLSAQAFWGNTNTETIVDKGHKDIVKPQNAEDMTVKILRNFLPKCLAGVYCEA